MPSISELERHRQEELTMDVQTMCMFDFYCLQTDQTEATMDEVEQYFEKLSKEPDDIDMAVYQAYEDEYMAHIGAYNDQSR